MKALLVIICLTSLCLSKPKELNHLVKKEIKVSDIIETHNATCEDPNHKHFKGTSFFFVTPWNSKGYDYALKYGSKIDVISPVWYEIGHKEKTGEIYIDGSMNSTWLRLMRDKHPNVKIYPRLVFKLDSFT